MKSKRDKDTKVPRPSRTKYNTNVGIVMQAGKVDQSWPKINNLYL